MAIIIKHLEKIYSFVYKKTPGNAVSTAYFTDGIFLA